MAMDSEVQASPLRGDGLGYRAGKSDTPLRSQDFNVPRNPTKIAMASAEITSLKPTYIPQPLGERIGDLAQTEIMPY
jgi:hypothetical protein